MNPRRVVDAASTWVVANAARLWGFAVVAAVLGVSWQTLRDETARVAAQLRAWGIRPGERVVGFMPNIPQTVSTFLGASGGE